MSTVDQVLTAESSIRDVVIDPQLRRGRVEHTTVENGRITAEIVDETDFIDVTRVVITRGMETVSFFRRDSLLT